MALKQALKNWTFRLELKLSKTRIYILGMHFSGWKNEKKIWAIHDKKHSLSQNFWSCGIDDQSKKTDKIIKQKSEPHYEAVFLINEFDLADPSPYELHDDFN